MTAAFSSFQEPIHNFFDKEFQKFFCSFPETFTFHPFDQTMYKEIPIRKNKIIQTGAKSQFGGAMLGFVKLAYHSGIARIVKKEPIAPAIWHIKTEIKSFEALENFIYIS